MRGTPLCMRTCNDQAAYTLCEGERGVCVDGGDGQRYCLPKCGDGATCAPGAACAWLGYRQRPGADAGLVGVGVCLGSCTSSGPDACLAPPAGAADRARFLRWLVYLASALYGSDLRLFYPHRYTTDAAGAEGIKARAAETMMQEFAIYAEALGEGPFMLGRLSALDIYAAMLCSWAPDVAALFAAHPNLRRMYDAVLENEAVARVWERNGVPAV